MDLNQTFSHDYASARHKFSELCHQLGWHLESHRLTGRGAQGEELSLDVSTNRVPPDTPTLVLSSGLHGVEGYFGSAVQLAFLQNLIDDPSVTPAIRIVCMHAVNPYGFSHRRRFDHDNIDLNRNFLSADQAVQPINEAYRQLNSFLNPPHEPRPELFYLQALRMIRRHGYHALVQAIAGGQYEFPRGIFYGGSQPAESHRIVKEHWRRWLAEPREVIHLDWHTGLGAWAEYELLFDYALLDWHRNVLDFVAPTSSKAKQSDGDADYTTQGGWGAWCQHHRATDAQKYFYACAEFGTYRPITVLRGLRAENQSHHWGDPSASSTHRSKKQLVELFCPASSRWRQSVIPKSLQLINRCAIFLAQQR